MPGLGASLAQASWLEVRVEDRQTGELLADSAVCLGTPARVDQFGALRTDASGLVRFDGLPANSMELVVSHAGYQGRAQTLEALSGNRVVVVKLPPGGGGPTCAAPRHAIQAAASPGRPVIHSMRVVPDPSAADGRQLLLTLEVEGGANEVRISESADFSGAEWQPLKAEVPFSLSSGTGLKPLYVQVRRVAGQKGAEIELLSPVRELYYRSERRLP
ncbi:MAG TPA: carboxypeptidase regulatory-like domain-containing protein [Gammaproteobacteria bacterium]|nr:carboxypeptidase regulatory-like domain-containing protein [Gammaproteobacteria bacterium]